MKIFIMGTDDKSDIASTFKGFTPIVASKCASSVPDILRQALSADKILIADFAKMGSVELVVLGFLLKSCGEKSNFFYTLGAPTHPVKEFFPSRKVQLLVVGKPESILK